MANPKIKDIRVITTCPAGINLVVVKVETTEPGLYGLGCATFSYRAATVKHLIETYLRPLMIGRDVGMISENWQLMHQNAYWRSGPIENNAISGIDEALWDIKGKMAGMPLYELFGGKVRSGVRVYLDARGNTYEELFENVDRLLAQNVTAIRVGMGSGLAGRGMSVPEGAAEGALPGIYKDPRAEVNRIVEMFAKLRERYGDNIDFMVDVHERVHPIEARELCARLGPYHPYFIEDPVSIENIGWLKELRAHCSSPIAHGELEVNSHEWRQPVIDGSIDYIRAHISEIGGVTPAHKIAAFAEQFDVRTCWHIPGDISPVGAACSIHLDLSHPNCDLQEWTGIRVQHALQQNQVSSADAITEVFSGLPELRNGYLYVNEKPGHGVDIDEEAAAKYPCTFGVTEWTQSRRMDGSLQTP